MFLFFDKYIDISCTRRYVCAYHSYVYMSTYVYTSHRSHVPVFVRGRILLHALMCLLLTRLPGGQGGAERKEKRGGVVKQRLVCTRTKTKTNQLWGELSYWYY